MFSVECARFTKAYKLRIWQRTLLVVSRVNTEVNGSRRSHKLPTMTAIWRVFDYTVHAQFGKGMHISVYDVWGKQTRKLTGAEEADEDIK